MKRNTLAIGLHFDGAHGQRYNNERVIALAKHKGWQPKAEPEDKFLSPEELQEYDAEDALTFLEDFAPEGYWVGWNDGDFGVWLWDEYWNE